MVESVSPTPGEVAAALQVSVGMLSRRTRQTKVEGEMTVPEVSALARLDRGGPTTSSALAKIEQISPQSMGATLGALETRGLITRSADPEDGRRVVLAVSEAGMEVLRNRRAAKAERWERALSSEFTPEELEQLMATAPLIERLARSI
jgi:DNA-binding MarR family transcriptional regulator